MSLPYYPMYPRDFFEGTQEMSLEQKGAYIMVLNLMYTRGGPISDDPGYISRYIGCSITKWTGKTGSGGLRDQLVEMGKLVAGDGTLSNARADGELTKLRQYSDGKARNRTNPNKNNDEESRPITTHAKPEPEPKPEVSRVVFARGELSNVSEADLNELEANCRKWANGSLAERAGPLILGPVIRLLKPVSGEPCTIDDVRNGITKAAASLHKRGQTVSGLGYFEKPILSERDERLTPLPEPENRNERAGQGQSGRAANGRGHVRAGAGREHGTAPLDAAYQRLFGGDQAPADVSDEPIDGRAEWVA